MYVLGDILDISSKLSAISREKISKLKRFSASFRALAPIFGLLRDGQLCDEWH